MIPLDYFAASLIFLQRVCLQFMAKMSLSEILLYRGVKKSLLQGASTMFDLGMRSKLACRVLLF